MQKLPRVGKGFAALCLAVGASVLWAAPVFADGGGGSGASTLFVSNTTGHPDHDGNGGWGRHREHGCSNASYTTISSAIAAASAGDTIIVCPGTYTEDDVIAKPLTLIGESATIDAAGLNNGFQVVTSGVTIQGFTITGAIGEGILVGVDSLSDPSVPLIESEGLVLSNIDIIGNDVANDDQGFSGPGGSTSTCIYGGDCGGGIHLNVVSNSILRDNSVSGNADGILLTDDYGPNFDNVIVGNDVFDNATECGITLPSHNPNAVSYNATTGQVTGTNPTEGGVYGNKIIDNVAIDNGTVVATEPSGAMTGSGAGVGIFGSVPGTGSYDNLVAGNFLAGNGLGGVTIHAHAPGGEDVNGNVIVRNVIGTNNLGGDPEDGPPFPSDPSTTGISVFSAVASVQITIAHNVIYSNAVGIWYTSSTVTVTGLKKNRFHHDASDVTAA